MESIKFRCFNCEKNALLQMVTNAAEFNLDVLEIEIKRCYKAIREMEELRLQLQEEMKQEDPANINAQ